PAVHRLRRARLRGALGHHPGLRTPVGVGHVRLSRLRHRRDPAARVSGVGDVQAGEILRHVLTSVGILLILGFFVVILLLTRPIGLFMARVFQGERTFLHPIVRPLETFVYRVVGVREDEEQRWTQYAASVLGFSLFAFLFTYAFMRLQGVLPLNPQR